MTAPLVVARNLSVEIPVDGGTVRPVDGVDLEVRLGDTIALIGPSGSGKSLTVRALLGLAPTGGRVDAETLTVDGVEILSANYESLRRLRGAVIGILPQDADATLNPVLRLAAHFRETHRAHGGAPDWHSRSWADLEAVDLDPTDTLRAFPHQLSGGQRQRAALALALAPAPRCLIADEPTANLDAIARLQVLACLDRVVERADRALVLITHDVSTAAGRTDTALVMLHGHIVEAGPTGMLVQRPRHPWTRTLTDAARGVATGPPTPGPRSLSGCRFSPTCPSADDRCRRDRPTWSGTPMCGVRCHHPLEHGS